MKPKPAPTLEDGEDLLATVDYVAGIIIWAVFDRRDDKYHTYLADRSHPRTHGASWAAAEAMYAHFAQSFSSRMHQFADGIQAGEIARIRAKIGATAAKKAQP